VRNQPRNVAAQSPGQDALIDLRLAGDAKGTPGDVLRRVVRLGSGSEIAPTTINGLPAAVATTSMSGRPTRIAVVFHAGRAYVIGAQARGNTAFNQYQSEFDASIASFHEMTSEERLHARPLALRVITAPPGLTYAELARLSPLGKNAEGHLRVINGMYPKGEPVAGQALKIID
jgi:predicted Zn-dependent protease